MSNEPVIFRMWHGDVIALFPAIAADVHGINCLSYQHIGQHGGADYDTIVRDSRPATQREYRELKRELTRIGYRLRVVQRRTPAHRDMVRAGRC